MKKFIAVFITLLFVSQSSLLAQPSPINKMEWWHNAKFGMFIHWGVYSMYGGIYKGYHQARGDAAWIENRCKIPVAEYRQHASDFNPTAYNPDEWVKMAKDAGMKYLIITAKHHDGFALFKTKASDWNVVQATKYGKDLLLPLAKACKKYGIKLGFYYSQAVDWTNPGASAARRLMNEGWPNPDSTRIDEYTKEHDGHWDPIQLTSTFDRYVDSVAVPQVTELLTHYGKVSILWWDYGTQMKSITGAKKLQALLSLQPNIITNDRLHPDFPGDTKTPEQAVPDMNAVADQNWETCMTMNNSWGYKSFDKSWKSSATLISNLIRIVARGGNYLLNIGPKPDGTFPDECIQRLKDIGSWMKTNGESIYGTHPSSINLPNENECTQIEKKGKTTLYLFILNWPTNGEISIPNLSNNIISIHSLANKQKLPFHTANGHTIIQVPLVSPSPIATVIKLKLNGPLARRELLPKKEMQSGALD